MKARPIVDEFRGDNLSLRDSIEALIELNDSNSLVPHGIGGHARTLLASCYHRLHAPDRPLTRREQFAMAAMQGLLANPVVQESSVKIPELAGEAVMYADALIAALEKKEAR